MFSLRVFDIKIIAIIAMIIDHMGVFLYPSDIFFRIIGRIAFPLFAWMIANGAYHTHNMKNYLFRLGIFAILSQIPFLLPNQYVNPYFGELNVLFTLFLGLLSIALIKQTNNKAMWILSVTICMLIADFIKSDYGAFGVLSIVAFYLTYHSKLYTIITQIFILGIIPALFSYLSIIYYHSLVYYYLTSSIEIYGLFSLIFILLYRGKQGPKVQYLFYTIYPIQYIVFYLILRFA